MQHMPVARPPDQFGFVTSDLERATTGLATVFGVPSWRIHRFDRGILRFASYRGRPGTYASRNAVSVDGRIGVVEPFEGPSVHLDALTARGPGLAYLTWVVDDLAPVALWAVDAGIAEAMRGGGHGLDGDGEFVYYDTFDMLGVYCQFTTPPRRRRAPSAVWDDAVRDDAVRRHRQD